MLIFPYFSDFLSFPSAEVRTVMSERSHMLVVIENSNLNTLNIQKRLKKKKTCNAALSSQEKAQD